ncbi:CbtA family protein [Paraburkholderia silvatlantica]|uniref:Putative cobalt transporter CbtA n=1 Tax=Paraburkholderia silvatlantica TaxID=321895 RepID=A0A2V4U5M1_9BURK|nr:CbtA family protein [Paraburkholderia silvatlantica]PYE17276.1 putative cobalt transporter CbtA [Paraburkholderia silvatlantica]TDQ81122.1 putative cobalt transporter CbtA [Paraburkholderia silvatlantica]
MVGKWLLRGMLSGVVAGLLTFCFARVAGEPQVDQAISFEQKMDAVEGHADEPELVSRHTQAGLGLLTGVVVYGTAIGGLFALVFSYAYGRIGKIGAQGLSVVLALIALIVVVIAPGLKYPANPPSVGDPDTIGMRTALYFLMIVTSLLAMVFSARVRRSLIARLGAWNATLTGIGLYVLIIAAIEIALPTINEVPAAFPAVVLWKFRIAALGMQIVMWTTLGLLFGALAQRSLKGRDSTHAQLRARPAA